MKNITKHTIILALVESILILSMLLMIEGFIRMDILHTALGMLLIIFGSDPLPIVEES